MCDEILPSSPAPSNAALLDAALTYAARGWSIIPVIGKRSPRSWKQYQQRRADEATLRQMFAIPGITGLAVIVGHVSGGLACRDYDEQAAYDRWAASHPKLARTLPTVATASGYHVFFRGPAHFEEFDDGEYRGTAGQYVVLPPSRHPDGIVYRWVNPLPEGELPVIDPAEVGLCNREDGEDGEGADNGANREDGANRESRGDREDTDNTRSSLAPSLLQSVENAVAATQPTRVGQRHHGIFNFARHLKGIHGIRELDFAGLRPLVEQWHQRALPTIGTRPFLDTWAEFVQAWQKVKVPAGENPIHAAFNRATQVVASDPPLAVIKLYGHGPIVLLAAFCQELQRIVGDREFFIDCRTAGRLIGVDHTTAWRYLHVLCADGVLAEGTKGSNATRKASRFRFINPKRGRTDHDEATEAQQD